MGSRKAGGQQVSSHGALSQSELLGRRFAALWNWQDAPSRDAWRLLLTSGWLQKAGTAGAVQLPSPGTMGSGEGNTIIICILSPLAVNQTIITLSRTDTHTQQGHRPDAGNRNWGQWEESGAQQPPRAAPWFALSQLLVQPLLMGRHEAGKPVGHTPSCHRGSSLPLL